MYSRVIHILLLLCILPASVCAQLQPDDLPGLELWLRSDTGITTISNGVFISQWNDISGNDRHCTNPLGGNFMPGPEPNVINGKPSVSFFGINDFLNFPEITNIRTVFWLVKEFPSATSTVPRCLLGHSSSSDFLRGPEKVMWHPTNSSAFVRNGTTRINLSEVDGTQSVVPTELSIISLVTTGDVRASSITVNQLTYSNVWAGQFIELIVYSAALSPEEVEEVENYLADRYTPPFYVSADVNIPYGFCATTISAAPGFDSYLWSTGETTSTISVNNSGDYWVQAVDRFDRVHEDTVHVTFPGNTQAMASTICLGDTITWDTQLPGSEYTFLWSDATVGSENSFSIEGNYTLQVSDTNGCNVITALDLLVDSISQQVSLGPDADLCSGNAIGLQSHPFTITSYLWNDNSTDEQLVVNESGEYSIQVVDQNGCIANDTIAIEIIGTAPVIDFETGNLCELTTSQFTGLDLSSSEIVSWNWSIEGAGDYSGQNISVDFSMPGEYPVFLEAMTLQGCIGYTNHTAVVHALPSANFNVSLACNNAPIVFTDLSTSVDGAIISWSWNIDDEMYTGPEVTALIPQAGFQPVELMITTEFGCTDDKIIQVDVHSSPVSDFTFSGQCFGNLTSFTESVDNTGAGPIVTYAWNFGDGTGSFLANPNHFFAEAGEYPVQLIAIAQSTCRDTSIQTVEIKALPTVDFLLINACLGQPFLLQDLTSSDDEIISWTWNVENLGVFTGPSPEVIFSETGFQQVELSVQTEFGCTGSLQQSIPVWNVPSADFAFTPEVGLAPVEIQFENLSSGATTYYWDFGDFNSSQEENPSHVYEANGNYTIQLRSENNAGCFVTLTRDIIIDVPVTDVAVQQLNFSPGSAGTSITALVVNQGNVIVHGLYLSWSLGNDAAVSEYWNGTLEPGNSLSYPFSSEMNPSSTQFAFVCVTAYPDVSTFPEMNTGNNTLCAALDETTFILFPPFPNPAVNNLSVRFLTPLTGEIQLRITDASGRVCKDWIDPEVAPGFHEYSFGMDGLAPGNYVIDLIQSDRKLQQHFVKINAE